MKALNNDMMIDRQQLLKMLEAENLDSRGKSDDVLFLWTKCAEPSPPNL